jgi:hypothetical protein
LTSDPLVVQSVASLHTDCATVLSPQCSQIAATFFLQTEDSEAGIFLYVCCTFIKRVCTKRAPWRPCSGTCAQCTYEWYCACRKLNSSLIRSQVSATVNLSCPGCGGGPCCGTEIRRSAQSTRMSCCYAHVTHKPALSCLPFLNCYD